MCQLWNVEFCVLVSLPTSPKNTQMEKTKGVAALVTWGFRQVLGKAAGRCFLSPWGVLNNQCSTAIIWTPLITVCVSLNRFVCTSSNCALMSAIKGAHIRKCACLCTNRHAVMGNICMSSASVCACVCVSLMTAGWLSCCIVMSYGCLSGSCSHNLLSQLTLPHTHTHKCAERGVEVHALTREIPHLWESIKALMLL